MTKQSKSWRDVIMVHPAADLFPMMNADELKALGEDIKKNGLTVPLIFWSDAEGKQYLLDGRNRLDAMEQSGRALVRGGKLDLEAQLQYPLQGDPFKIALTLDLHRRHLDAEQKRDLIAKVLKAQPSKSNRAIAKQTKADDKTVAAVRGKLEVTAEIPQLTRTVGIDGKARTKTPKKKRRDVDDYLAEKKTRLAATQNIEAQPDTITPIVDNTVLADAVTSRVQMQALSSELAQFYDDYSARVKEWAKTCPDHQFTSATARLFGQVSSQLRRLAQEIEGDSEAPAASEDLEVAQ